MSFPSGPLTLRTVRTAGTPAGFVTSEQTKTRLFDALAVATLMLVAAIALMTFRDYGLGWDDVTHLQYGDLLLSLYGSGFTDARALSFVNLHKYGGGARRQDATV